MKIRSANLELLLENRKKCRDRNDEDNRRIF
jgi:hypothetical protein